MSGSRPDYDVAIIGAGPSGAVAAAMLQSRALRVLVLERQQFPRFSIGESLLPQCMEFLQQSNMLERVAGAGFQLKNGAAFSFGNAYQSFDFGAKFGIGWEYTYQVERARFDQILADEAERQGAEIRYRHTITGYQENAHHASLDVSDDQGRPYCVNAGFVLDASGYGRVLARQLKLEKPAAFESRTSIFAHVADNIVDRGFDRNKILISVHPQRPNVWYWLIPFAGERASIGVVGPTAYLDSLPGNDLDRLRCLVAETSLKATLLARAEFDSASGRISGYSCAVSRLHGERFALLGNAAEFLDPVFSSGVTIALKSASLAAELVARQLAGQRVDWERSYVDPLMRGVETFRAFVNAWYDGRLQRIIFSPNKEEDVKSMLCAILAGYAWDWENPYVRKPARLDTLYEICSER